MADQGAVAVEHQDVDRDGAGERRQRDLARLRGDEVGEPAWRNPAPRV